MSDDIIEDYVGILQGYTGEAAVDILSRARRFSRRSVPHKTTIEILEKEIREFDREFNRQPNEKLVEAVRKAYEFADEVYWHDPENSEQAGEMAKHFQDVLKELGEW